MSNVKTTGDGQELLGRTIDRLDNVAHALALPMSADFHIRQMNQLLPGIIADLKKYFAEVTGENPWEE